jgi:Ulp1 family protease
MRHTRMEENMHLPPNSINDFSFPTRFPQGSISNSQLNSIKPPPGGHSSISLTGNSSMPTDLQKDNQRQKAINYQRELEHQIRLKKEKEEALKMKLIMEDEKVFQCFYEEKQGN